MKLFLEIVITLVALNVAVVLVLVIGNAIHERRRRGGSEMQAPDIDDIIATLTEEVEEGAVVRGYVLELARGEASVLRLGDNGIVNAITLLGPAENAADAETLAGICGWQTASEWADGETAFASIVPKPISVAFVGTSEIFPDDAVRMARNAGVEVVDYISQRVEEAEGKTYVSFSVDKPRGWVDSEIPAYA
jgi:hypothetical protein